MLDLRDFCRQWCWWCFKVQSSSFWRVDDDSFQNQGLLLVRGEHPSLGSGDEVGIPQLLGVAIFGGL